MNWARRAACNVCNTPKFAKAEQRTGYGGGYMERDEIVEYNKREESDDEFDEVGLGVFLALQVSYYRQKIVFK